MTLPQLVAGVDPIRGVLEPEGSLPDIDPDAVDLSPTRRRI
jgi:hypothetical protein